jgi:hypothetical protein
MYLRQTVRKKNGTVHRYWCLVRSVRVGRRVIQQTVAHLGELDDRGRLAAQTLARRLIGAPEEASLFQDGSGSVTVPVRLKGIRVERSRQFGDVYLALALWRGTGLEALCQQLLPEGKERIAWAKLAAVLVVARFCEPSSVRLRCVTQPDAAQAALLDRLGIILPKRMRLAEYQLPALAISA